MPEIITTSMGLTVPAAGPGGTPGPSYATEINQNLQIIDQHDHSTGKGVQLTPAGLNINGNLPFNGNNITLIRSVRFQAQGSPITGSSSADLGCVYVAGVDLYYNDVSGNQVRLTSGGSVAGAAGSITGLVAPATATYVAVSTKFVWQSDANIAADLDMRSAILRNAGASSFGLTLQAPTLAGDTSQTFPQTPGATAFVTMDATGAMATNITQALGITRPMQAAVGQQVSATCGAIFQTSSTSAYGTIGSLSISITTTGRPVMLMAISDNTGQAAYLGSTNAGPVAASFAFFRDGSVLAENSYQSTSSSTAAAVLGGVPPGSVNFLDVVAAGTYTYSLRAKTSLGIVPAIVNRVKIVAYEL